MRIYDNLILDCTDLQPCHNQFEIPTAVLYIIKHEMCYDLCVRVRIGVC